MIYTKFWFDDYISSLKPKEKLLFIYLITNEKVSICGIYEIPDKYILLDTGLNQKELKIMKQKFMQAEKFVFINNWIKIINFNSYNTFTGEKNERAIEKELDLIPKKVIDYQYPINRVSRGIDTLNNHNHNTNHNKLLINNIIEYLNERTGKNFRLDAKSTIKHIQARINEGYVLEDFKKVVDIKCKKWKADSKMFDYLRPETLFGTKFESYLNEKEEAKEDWRTT